MTTDFGTVGVVIPTCNRRELLRTALESVLLQTYRNLRVVVMDDGSTDGTADYLASVRDPRLTSITNERGIGLAENVNRGVASLPDAVKWFTVLCDDDYYDSGCIAALVAMADHSRARAIVHGRMDFVSLEGGFLRAAKVPPPEETAYQFVHHRSIFATERYLSGMLLSRQYFGEIGGYPVLTTGMAADDALIFAMALQDRLVYAKDATAYVRIHGEAESQRFIDIRDHLCSLRDYRDYCLNAAQSGGRFDADQLSQLDRTLLTHVRQMNDRLWIGSIKQLIRRKVPDYRRHVDGMYALGGDETFAFSRRVRFDSFVGNRTGICLESMGAYRYAWRLLSKLK